VSVNIRIVASGEEWVGYGIRSFSSVIEEVISNARKKLVMTIYVLTDMNIVKGLQKALERGISVEIFIYFPSHYPENEAVDEFIKMESRYDYLKIHRIKNEVLHAKVLVADGETALVGSANPTFGGMVRNYELGFLVEDQKISHKILTILWRLKEG